MAAASIEPGAPAQPPSTAAIAAAAERIRGICRRTPLERSAWLSEWAGCDIFLKLECWQPTRSFKVRGAVNAVLAQVPDARARGVVAASAGNHGQALALAARAAGAHATVFVPRDSPQVKQARMRALGAELRADCEDYDAAELAAAAHARASGALLVHAFSDPLVVAGQATIARELVEDLPQLAEVIVPVGGGGLINGVAAGLRALDHPARVRGAQSELTPNLHAALLAGRLVPCPVVPTLCDGLAGCTDERALALAQLFAHEVVLVKESSIAKALRGHLTWDGVLTEGSGAVAAAAVLERRFALRGPTVLVLTGGNVDPDRLTHILKPESP